MKKALIIFCLAVIAPSAKAQSSCCAMSSTEEFAMLSDDKEFRELHREPEPFTYVSHGGQMISFATPDGKTANAFMIKGHNTNRNLFVFHEWWGLNDYIKQTAEALFHMIPNVNVYAVDLYDGKVTDNRDSAAAYSKALTDARATAIINGMIGHVGKDAVIANIGWCMGGAWSLQSALLAGTQNVGTVMYYGMPEKNVGRLKQLSGDVLMIAAKLDKKINTDVVEDFKKNMDKAGKNLVVETYDADHAFANPSNPGYDKTKTEEANKKALQFLMIRLQ